MRVASIIANGTTAQKSPVSLSSGIHEPMAYITKPIVHSTANAGISERSTNDHNLRFVSTLTGLYRKLSTISRVMHESSHHREVARRDAESSCVAVGCAEIMMHDAQFIMMSF